MPNSSIVCVDASFVVRLVTRPAIAAVQVLWERWTREHLSLNAPTLLRYEVTNALYRYQRHGLLPAVVANEALRTALVLPITLHGDAALHGDAVAVARRFNLPAAYDAHYLALAERLDGEFFTADGRLGNAVQAELPWVHVVR
jgi:predicted nucleic acid-binding protein